DPAPCLGGAARARCALARAGRHDGGRGNAGGGAGDGATGPALGCEGGPAAVGPLGVRRSTLDRVADLVSGARADEPHHEVEDEPQGRELQDPQGQSKQATEDAEEDVERDERQGSEKREAKNAAKHGRIPPCGPTLGPYVAM